jgi:hypothetical protein
MNASQIAFRRLALTTTLTIAVCGLALPARAETLAYDLVIQRSPPEAGDVTPTIGPHRVLANSSVTLTANPQPGYRFAYWLGDVSDPGAERTTILVDQPKIVIAVFHPETPERLEDQIRATGAGGAPDMLTATATDLSTPGWSPPAGASNGGTTILRILAPVVIPEPHSFVLFVLAMLALPLRPRYPGPRQPDPPALP